MLTRSFFCLPLMTALLPVGCATDSSKLSADDDVPGVQGGKADDATASRGGFCLVFGVLQSETPSAFPTLAAGDLMRFSLETSTITTAIAPEFGGGTVTRAVRSGHVMLDQPVRMLDPDLHIVSRPFEMELTISSPHVDTHRNIVQDVAFTTSVFDVHTQTMRTKAFQSVFNVESPIPYADFGWSAPDAASAAPGDLVGGALFCVMNDRDPLSGSGEALSIDDVAQQ